MRNWKDVASSLFWIAAGLGLLWFCWDTWEKFAQLESGQRESMKVWAPIALIYNLGGIWTTIAKWVFLAFFGLCGVFLIYVHCVLAILQTMGNRSSKWETILLFPLIGHLFPKRQAASTQYDVSYDLEVTKTQIANEEEIFITGPNGKFAIKLQKKIRNGRLRFRHEGRGHKGDLYVILKIRNV